MPQYGKTWLHMSGSGSITTSRQICLADAQMLPPDKVLHTSEPGNITVTPYQRQKQPGVETTQAWEAAYNVAAHRQELHKQDSSRQMNLLRRAAAACPSGLHGFCPAHTKVFSAEYA